MEKELGLRNSESFKLKNIYKIRKGVVDGFKNLDYKI
jgi:hypothetical protein